MPFLREMIVEKEVENSKLGLHIKPNSSETDMEWLERQYKARNVWRAEISEAYNKIYGMKFVVLAIVKYLIVIVACVAWLGESGVAVGIITALLLRQIDVLALQLRNVDHLLQAESAIRAVLKEMIDELNKKII